jgi:hypothetical protein
MPTRRIEKRLEDNRSAVADFAATASVISEDAWHEPIAAGKWSPAQHVDHVARAYAAAVLEIEHGSPMRLIGSPRQRWWWRLLGLSLVRFFGRLPRGAPAPREIRPPQRSEASRPELLAELDEQVRAFEKAVRGTADLSGRGFTHPYFGSLNALDGIRLLAVHTRHHARALRPPVAHSAGR